VELTGVPYIMSHHKSYFNPFVMMSHQSTSDATFGYRSPTPVNIGVQGAHKRILCVIMREKNDAVI